MKRPTIDQGLLTKVAIKWANAHHQDCDLGSMIDAYRNDDSGLQMGLYLHKYEGWDISEEDIDLFDEFSRMVDSELKRQEKQWAIDNNILPPYPVGTKLINGVIEAVDKYGVARYLVKENGCTTKGRHLIIKFENAELDLS